MILMKDVQHAAHCWFSAILLPTDPIPASPFTSRSIDPANVDGDKKVFYDRVNASVLAKLIENTLTTIGFQDLLLQKDMFTFTDSATGEVHFDGPTMLKIILTQIDPDTIVGMDTLKAQLESMKLHEHGNDVAKMLTSMQSIYNTLKENGHEPDSYRCYIYTALISGPNADFNAFMQRIIDDIQSGNGYHKNITTDNLIITACTKYNNMVADKTWGKVDPRNAKIMALTTALEEIKKNNSSKSTDAANATDGGGKVNKFATLEEWRMKFDGDIKVVSGRTFYWCKHHKGKHYDGLYVSSHSPEHHDAWVKDKHASRNGRYLPKDAVRAPSKPDDKDAANKSTLGLTDKLKQVLMTNACMSKEDVDKMYQLAQEN